MPADETEVINEETTSAETELVTEDHPESLQDPILVDVAAEGADENDQACDPVAETSVSTEAETTANIDMEDKEVTQDNTDEDAAPLPTEVELGKTEAPEELIVDQTATEIGSPSADSEPQLDIGEQPASQDDETEDTVPSQDDEASPLPKASEIVEMTDVINDERQESVVCDEEKDDASPPSEPLGVDSAEGVANLETQEEFETDDIQLESVTEVPILEMDDNVAAEASTECLETEPAEPSDDSPVSQDVAEPNEALAGPGPGEDLAQESMQMFA